MDLQYVIKDEIGIQKAIEIAQNDSNIDECFKRGTKLI